MLVVSSEVRVKRVDSRQLKVDRKTQETLQLEILLFHFVHQVVARADG